MNVTAPKPKEMLDKDVAIVYGSVVGQGEYVRGDTHIQARSQPPTVVVAQDQVGDATYVKQGRSWEVVSAHTVYRTDDKTFFPLLNDPQRTAVARHMARRARNVLKIGK